MAAGDEMAERTVPLLRRPWPVLPDHHPDPVVTTHASVRHGPGRVHLRAQRHQARRRYGRRRCDDALARPLDHAGAMPRALQMMTLANGGRRVPTYMHPDMFASRAVKANDGRLMPMEDIPSEHVLAANGADLIIARNEQSVLSNTVFISGEIPRVTSFEKGMPGQHRLDAAGEWIPDELLVDERFVAVHLATKGLFVFTACSHAGLINVLTHAAERFAGIPLFGVLGGFHLAGPTEAIIPETVDALEAFDLQLMAAAHCTGWRALGQLAQRFGDRVVASAVGKRFVL